MRKIVGIALSGLLVTAMLTTVAPAKTLKIGMMGPLTGPYAADGNDIANGARVAIDVINEEGGIPGFDKIELFPQDIGID